MKDSRKALALALLGSGLFGGSARGDDAEGYVRFVAGQGLTPVSATAAASEYEGVVRLRQIPGTVLPAPVAPLPTAPPLLSPAELGPVELQAVPVISQGVPVLSPGEPHLILSATHAVDPSRKPGWGQLPLALASPRLDVVIPSLHPAHIRTGLASGRGLSRLPSLDLARGEGLAHKPAAIAAPVAVAAPVRTENSIQIARTEPAAVPAAVESAPAPAPGKRELVMELRRAAEEAVGEKPLVAETVDGPRTRPRSHVDGIGSGELAIVTAPRSGKDLGLDPVNGFQSGNTSIGLRIAQAPPPPVAPPGGKSAPIEEGDGPMPSRKEPARARTESEIAAMLRAPVADISVDDPTQDPATSNERPDSLAAKYAAPGIFVSNWTWPEPRHQRYTYPFYHTPLYFEDANLERCGLGYGVFQPWVSSGRFIGQTFIWPAAMFHRCPYEHVVTPGDCRTCEKFRLNTTSAK
ncbi:hypothetical protein [Planctomyces sp. SH-PL14]|uniref:hypothetical protein n=1 Tax=Planctomyces sp. SH-PL14 TaxID=1632864 RepID=UPI00078C2BF6|nr:hypothetical protein [Planctomyces sp. SH-PL14]AMV20497.1 hypothetical protein VT03_21545 [Planctomyces sp. SH-PL14]